MKIDASGIDELKGWECDLTDAKEAHRCDEVNRKVGEHCGRVHVKPMKNLIVSGVETTIAKPSHLAGDGVTEEAKAIWSEECDVHLKDKKSHDENEGEAFVIAFGKCTKAMKNCIKKLGIFEDIERDNDAIALLKAIEQQAFDANERSALV